ncbi:hypothetical protein NUSPORA_01142 [Nucleospora cyclopteri]
MLKSFFRSKEELDLVMINCKLLRVNYNNKVCSKVTYFSIINTGETGETLKTLKNVLDKETFIMPIYRITAHSIFTKRITPYISLPPVDQEYKEYIVYKINSAVEFLSKYDFIHSNLTKESIFIDEAGNPVLGNLADIKKQAGFCCKKALDALSEDITGKLMGELSLYGIYIQIENFLRDFNKIEFSEKKNFMKILETKSVTIYKQVKSNIFNFILENLNKDGNKTEKLALLDFLRNFDKTLFNKNQVEFFKILDCNVRLYLLTELELIDKLDECASDIALGIIVKEKSLRLETLAFIFKHSNKFSRKSHVLFIETITETVTDGESILYICTQLIDKNLLECNNEAPQNTNDFKTKEFYRQLYKMLVSFIKTNKCKTVVFTCLEKYYKYFDKYKISSELLPLLCGKLVEKDQQDLCFNLVESIVRFLKENRAELEQKDWAMKRVKDIFKNKEKKREEIYKNKIREIKNIEKFNDEWDEQEI